jgi:hypothetical protein
MVVRLSFERLRSTVIATATQVPDHRTGQNTQYAMADAVLSAFAMFYVQSPSFLAYERDGERAHGRQNAYHLFGLEKVPSAPQTRNLLDPLRPSQLGAPFWNMFDQLRWGGYLKAYQGGLSPWLISFDGSQYFHSTRIHCPQCREVVLNGQPHYAHTVVAPVLVAPGQPEVIVLEPEFITPQDGQEKQDCELRASERWLTRQATRFAPGSVTYLADDLYCHQPFCELVRAQQQHFAFTCKPESHTTLYTEIALLSKIGGLGEYTERCAVAGQMQVWRYRYVNRLPLRAEAPVLYVNWCEVTITREATGEQLYHNAWATDHDLRQATLHRFVQTARSHWKHENEGHNVLKQQGYHLEHNFGHGTRYLAQVLLLLNLLAFLVHTALAFCDETYQAVRANLATRITFFNDVRALLRYLDFDSWQAILTFMKTQLERTANPAGP